MIQTRQAPRIFFFLIWMLVILHVHAQETVHHIELLTERDGLNDLVINDLITDRNGVLWVGTENGLNRYLNGRFDLYHEFSTPGRTVGHNVTSLFMDSRNRLWIGDRLKGITVYNPASGEWSLLSNSGPKAVYNGKEVLMIEEARDQTIWALVYPSILVQFSSDLLVLNEFHFSPPGKTLSELSQANSFAVLDDTTLLLTTFGEGVYTLHVPTGTFLEQEWINAAIGKKNYYGNVKKLSDTLFFLKAGTKSYLGNSGKQQLTLLEDGLNPLTTSFCILTETGHFWVVQSPNIWLYDPKGEIVEQYEIQIPNSLAHLNINTKKAWIDPSSIVWIGSDQGILKIDLKKQAFKVAQAHKQFKKGRSSGFLSGTYVRYIKKTRDQSLLIGYVDERYIDEITPEQSDGRSRITKTGACELQRNQTVNQRVNGLYESEHLGLFATTYNGIFHRKPGSQNSRLLQLRKNESYPIQNTVWCMLELDRRYLILGSRQNGLHLYDHEKKEIRNIVVTLDNAVWDPSTSVWDFYTDSRNRTWLLTSAGLYRIQTVHEEEIKLEQILKLEDFSIWAICETPSRELWAGSIEHGIFCFDSSSGFIGKIDFTSGLTSMSICSLITDDQGYIWASSPNGLSVIDPKSKKVIRYFNYHNGISIGGFNYRSCAKDEYGNLYFGTKNGLLYFQPKLVLEGNLPAKPVSRMVLNAVNGNFTLSRAEIVSPIEIGPGFRNLMIEPALTDYSNPAENRYSYILEGFEKNWNEIRSQQPMINYPNLPPGTYTLKIRGENSLGFPAENTLAIPVTVVPFFWETSWFFFLIIALIVLVAILLIRVKLKSDKMEKKLLESEIESFRSQMNPHFFFNALNSIQDYIFHKEREKAADFMSGFAQLLRKMLDSSSRKFMPLSEEVQFLRQYLDLESLRFDGLLSYKINIDPSVQADEVMVPTMLIQPLVENAIKHGLTPKKKDMFLGVTFHIEDHLVHCEVVDNGVGRTQKADNKGYTSRGLLIIQERLKLLSKNRQEPFLLEIMDLLNGEGQPCGTKVRLIFS